MVTAICPELEVYTWGDLSSIIGGQNKDYTLSSGWYRICIVLRIICNMYNHDSNQIQNQCLMHPETNNAHNHHNFTLMPVLCGLAAASRQVVH
mmetsp:Transcript_18088/g.26858  ORF Transcript_18088/g.26858 Transcript_18088/m.26858 type:complete len:93 (-) Transcript_18088:913-1191(-)